MTKYYYRDFVTRKRRWTRGAFSHWTQGGILNAWYAVFRTGKGAVLVPDYLLEWDTKTALPPHDPR